MTDTAQIIAEIRYAHRQRRFAMKIQQKLDRALESYVRINATEWRPDMDEKERDKINTQVKAMIKAARDGKSKELIEVVTTSDQARQPADRLRNANEKKMEELAVSLPIYEFIEGVRGVGALGLATIVAETGDISNYPNVAKIWKRLGFAPYDGLAGSTWKRETWRPRTLSAEEWTENPFSGQRYALIHQSAVWLRNAQWIGAEKSEDGKGKPNGPYGEIYAARRTHTAKTHPDWSAGHADKDALRIMMKEFLKVLWAEWHRIDAGKPERPAKCRLKSKNQMPGDNPKRKNPQPLDGFDEVVQAR